MRIAAMLITTPLNGAFGRMNCVGTTISCPSPGSHGSTLGLARRIFLVADVEAARDVGKRVVLAGGDHLYLAHDGLAGLELEALGRLGQRQRRCGRRRGRRGWRCLAVQRAEQRAGGEQAAAPERRKGRAHPNDTS